MAAYLVGRSVIVSVVLTRVVNPTPRLSFNQTDTIASMAGQVMGTYLGQSQLPQAELRQLPKLDEITRIIDQFVDTVANAGSLE